MSLQGAFLLANKRDDRIMVVATHWPHFNTTLYQRDWKTVSKSFRNWVRPGGPTSVKETVLLVAGEDPKVETRQKLYRAAGTPPVSDEKVPECLRVVYCDRSLHLPSLVQTTAKSLATQDVPVRTRVVPMAHFYTLERWLIATIRYYQEVSPNEPAPPKEERRLIAEFLACAEDFNWKDLFHSLDAIRVRAVEMKERLHGRMHAAAGWLEGAIFHLDKLVTTAREFCLHFRREEATEEEAMGELFGDSFFRAVLRVQQKFYEQWSSWAEHVSILAQKLHVFCTVVDELFPALKDEEESKEPVSAVEWLATQIHKTARERKRIVVVMDNNQAQCVIDLLPCLGFGCLWWAGDAARMVHFEQPTQKLTLGKRALEELKTAFQLPLDPEDHIVCEQCGVCAKANLCARCKRVFYCGIECQKAHWPRHKAKCVAPTEAEVQPRKDVPLRKPKQKRSRRKKH